MYIILEVTIKSKVILISILIRNFTLQLIYHHEYLRNSFLMVRVFLQFMLILMLHDRAFSRVWNLFFCQRDDTYLLHLGLVLCYFKITCMTCLYILNFTVTCVPSLERYINNNTQYSITVFLPNYKWSFIDII